MAICEYIFDGNYCLLLSSDCNKKRSSNPTDCSAWIIEKDKQRKICYIDAIPDEIKRQIDGDVGLLRIASQ